MVLFQTGFWSGFTSRRYPKGQNMKRLYSNCGKVSDYGHIRGVCRDCYAKDHTPREVRIRDNQDRIFAYLDDKECVDCRETRSNVLQFDHVRGVKKANVTDLVSGGYGWETILKEIAKCDIRCANCHILRTAKQQGTWRSMLSTNSGEMDA